MDRAAGTLKGLLVKEYGLASSDVFLQGSYPNRTVIEPVEGGEYDIDMVAVCVDQNVTGDVALDDLEHRLAADGRYRDRIVRKAPCVRLEYSEDDIGEFHVDVVPLHRPPGTDELFAPRRGSSWKQTAPREYTEWCRNEGPRFARTVKILKRWRDEQQGVRDAIKSIVLQVLVERAMPDKDDDAVRIAATFRALHAELSPRSGPPNVPNPVLPFENLAASWPIQAFFGFVAELAEAVELMIAIEATDDVAEAASRWQELLGSDFPVPTADELGLKLLATDHAKGPESRGWTVSLDRGSSVLIIAHRMTKLRGRTMMLLQSNEPVPAGYDLRFKAVVTALYPVEVYWQVVNTGSEAESEPGGLRGEIFEAKAQAGGLSRNRAENWESTKYKGCHEIRALLVANNQVVAVSDYFKVPIFKGRQR